MTSGRRLARIAAVLLMGAIASVSARELIRIRVGTVVPTDTPWHRALEYLRRDWLRIVGPGLEMTIMTGLGDEHDLVRKARSGVIQAVGLSSVGLSRIDRSVSCLQVPMMLDSYEELDYVRDRMAPELERRIEARGFKVLHWADGGWVYVFTKKPVKTPDELRRLKLFTSAGDAVTEALYKDFGFQVVPSTSTDMVIQLQTNRLDAFAMVPLFAQLELFELAPYMTDVKWAPLVGGTVITLKAWESLPPDKRPALLEAARKPGRELRDTIRRLDGEAIREMQKRGLTVVPVDAATRTIWQMEAEKAYPKLRGDYCPPELFDEVRRLRDAFRAKGRLSGER
jgi:TRAP-type C4-dicarboxylate transport system substrate-binding protein